MKKREMKNSGIEWIGDIPANWKTSRVKHSVRWKSVKGQPDATVLSLYRDYGVIPKDSRGDNHNVTSLDTSGYKVVSVGDFVINKMKAWQGSMAVSEYNGIVSPAYHVCEIVNSNLYKKYFHYLMRNHTYLPEYTRLSTGMRIGQWDLGFDDFKNIPFILPPIEEQQKIVNFIVHKCAEIDAVIAKTGATIEEYKKLKQSIITEVVTKGVRGDRPVKYSGLEWIGYMCDEYDVWRMKFLISESLMYGANETGIPYEDTLPRYIRITDITGDGKLKDYGKLSLSEEAAAPYILKDNDVLLARSGGTVGKAFIYKKEYGKSAFAGYLIKASTNDRLLSDYLFYYTQSSLYEEWKKQIFIQATIQNIGADRYNNLPIVLPSVEEQKEIVSYLQKECAEMDTLIAKKTALLEELESYKKSIIYEYVTGKKTL